MAEMSVALDGLQEDQYRLGDLQAIPYDRKRIDLFPEGYLAHIYQLCKQSGHRSKTGILDAVFGGNPESSFDTIVAYLATRPLVIMGRWDGDKFKEYGFSFAVIFCGANPPERSCFGGYGFFSNAWGQPETPVLAMLGMALMFKEWGLKSLHGTRYESNVLTSRFMRQFGMKDVGRIPNYQLRDGVLVPAVVSSLDRADFEAYVENFLVEQYRATLHSEPVAEPEPHPEPEKPKESPQMSLGWL